MYHAMFKNYNMIIPFRMTIKALV